MSWFTYRICLPRYDPVGRSHGPVMSVKKRTVVIHVQDCNFVCLPVSCWSITWSIHEILLDDHMVQSCLQKSTVFCRKTLHETEINFPCPQPPSWAAAWCIPNWKKLWGCCCLGRPHESSELCFLAYYQSLDRTLPWNKNAEVKL